MSSLARTLNPQEAASPAGASQRSDEHAQLSNPVWDRAGLLISALCLIHCLALPVLAVLLPVAETVLPEHRLVHLAVIAVALPFAVVAFWIGIRHHGRREPAILGIFGLILIALSTVHADSEAIPLSLAVAGGLALGGAHWWNRRASRNCRQCCASQ